MITFASLLKSQVPPGAVQDKAAPDFPNLVAKSRLKLYTSEAAKYEDRKVLGVGAAYNNVDLEL